MVSFLDSLERICKDVVAPNADAVDKSASFPKASMDALRAAGFYGLTSASEMGGAGEGIRAAAHAVERLARECGSTAMVICMHYVGAAVIEKFGTDSTRREVAAGNHLSTLAFSEAGSRSHFWAPTSSAARNGHGVRLDAKKSWVTSANHATAYVWSSRPIAAEGASTIWLVPRDADGLRIGSGFDGIGLRGNDSTPVVAENVVVPEDHRLGGDGAGLDVMLGTVLPLFSVLNAACSIGLMEGATTRTCEHVAGTQYEHLGSSLAELPTIRAFVARMRIATDQARLLWLDTIDAIEKGRPDTMLRVLECKAAAGESATQVLDTAMRVCGGMAFRREVGVERAFRDARAASIMAPTTDQLYDFMGKALCGLPVF